MVSSFVPLGGNAFCGAISCAKNRESVRLISNGRVDHVGELWKLADFYQIEGLRYCCVVLVGKLERAGLV